MSAASMTDNVVAAEAGAATTSAVQAALSYAEIAGIVEASRLQRIIDLDRKIARLKLERECLASQVRAQMNRDGVVKHVIPGVGKASLLEGRPLHQCDSCASAIGEGKRDPYLRVDALC